MTSDLQPPLTVLPTFKEAVRYWLKLGFISFGGPTGQIALMHQDLVVKKKWIGEDQFLHALNFCMLLPGPEAQQLSIYLGWLMHGTKGGMVAGILFVLPAVIILWALSWLYLAGQGIGWLAGMFYGFKAAVIAIVAVAGLRLARKALKSRFHLALALISFVAAARYHAPFPLVIGCAAILGFVWGKRQPAPSSIVSADTSGSIHLAPKRSATVLSIGLACWWLPVLALGVTLGWNSIFVQQGLFFSKTAMVTIGGAYAVLPYVAQEAVTTYSWLSPGQMMDGLGLAETTPGPLIMVLQFVGFVGGWQHPHPGWSPLGSATLAAGISTWVTFAPCFLFILLGAPYVEKMRQHQGVKHALSAISAAVVGVMANLWGWFAMHSLLPEHSRNSYKIDWFLLTAAVAAYCLLQYKNWSVMRVIFLTGIAGIVWKLGVG